MHSVEKNVAVAELCPPVTESPWEGTAVIPAVSEGHSAEAVSVVAERTFSEQQYVYTDKPVYQAVKRAFDIVFSVVALIVFLPFLFIVALVIFLDDPHASPLFAQKRVGKGGRQFTFLKFRSMVSNAEALKTSLMAQNEADGPVFKIKDDPRITRVGRFLRKTSIDELPQLWNILKGDMSFIGPRPPLPNEVAQYTEHQLHRLDVKGGLTCYWQCMGRSELSFDEWVYLDLKYIMERGLRTDIKILFKTVGSVVKGKGAS